MILLQFGIICADLFMLLTEHMSQADWSISMNCISVWTGKESCRLHLGYLKQERKSIFIPNSLIQYPLWIGPQSPQSIIGVHVQGMEYKVADSEHKLFVIPLITWSSLKAQKSRCSPGRRGREGVKTIEKSQRALQPHIQCQPLAPSLCLSLSHIFFLPF